MGDDPAERLSDLGQFIREQRNTARLSLRRLSELAGISNPYLSQIERGLRRPSAEILQQIARALRISAETLYVQAGILDPPDGVAGPGAPDPRPIPTSARSRSRRWSASTCRSGGTTRASRHRRGRPSPSRPADEPRGPVTGRGHGRGGRSPTGRLSGRMRRLAVLSLHTSPLAQPGTGDGGGMNVYVRELASALARSGVGCDVFTRAWSDDLAAGGRRRARAADPPRRRRAAGAGGQGGAADRGRRVHRGGARTDGRAGDPAAPTRTTLRTRPSTPTTGSRAWPATPSSTSSTCPWSARSTPWTG